MSWIYWPRCQGLYSRCLARHRWSVETRLGCALNTFQGWYNLIMMTLSHYHHHHLIGKLECEAGVNFIMIYCVYYHHSHYLSQTSDFEQLNIDIQKCLRTIDIIKNKNKTDFAALSFKKQAHVTGLGHTSTDSKRHKTHHIECWKLVDVVPDCSNRPQTNITLNTQCSAVSP